MTAYVGRGGATLLVTVLMLSITACAGKNKASAIDIEREAFDDLRAEIREVIDDPFREMEALALTDELIEALDHLRERVTKRRLRMRELNEDYDTTREEFDAFFDDVEADIHVNRIEAIESERALVAVLTPEERILLEKLHTKAMKASIKSIQSI